MPIGLAARHLTDEEHIGQLGGGVLAKPIERASAAAHSREVDARCSSMNLTADLNDSRPGSKRATEMVGEHEVSQMICAEVDLEPISGPSPSCPHPGIIDEHIHRASRVFKCFRGASCRFQGGEVDLEELRRPTSTGDLIDNRLGSLRRSPRSHYVVPVGGQPDGGGSTNA